MEEGTGRVRPGMGGASAVIDPQQSRKPRPSLLLPMQSDTLGAAADPPVPGLSDAHDALTLTQRHVPPGTRCRPRRSRRCGPSVREAAAATLPVAATLGGRAATERRDAQIAGVGQWLAADGRRGICERVGTEAPATRAVLGGLCSLTPGPVTQPAGSCGRFALGPEPYRRRLDPTARVSIRDGAQPARPSCARSPGATSRRPGCASDAARPGGPAPRRSPPRAVSPASRRLRDASLGSHSP